MSTKLRQQYQSSFHVIQDARSQIREMVRGQMQEATLKFIHGLFREEMTSLCGAEFSRKGAEGCHRGGWDPGSVKLHGQRVAVRKPRAKRGGKDVELQSYAALQGFDMLQDDVFKHMMAGVSTRDYDGLVEKVSGGLGLKKSSVSKAFALGSRQAFDELNGRRLEPYTWAAVMIDGIEFGGSCVVVALGITAEGKKLVLGLKKGESEDSDVCRDLLQSLLDRGMKKDDPFLFVLDGSKGLRKAVRQLFGDRFPVQRCVRHRVPRKAQTRRLKCISTDRTSKSVNLGQKAAA